MARFDVKMEFIKDADQKITSFLLSTPKKDLLAQRFLYRYCMENGVNGAYVNFYLGKKNPATPSHNRNKLMRDVEHNLIYKQFLRQLNA